MTVIMAWREGDTTSTIDDVLRDEPAIVGEIAAEVAAERGLPPDWLSRIGEVLAPPPGRPLLTLSGHLTWRSAGVTSPDRERSGFLGKRFRT
ncbi:hypothetical protein [Candidatus Poriferisodalis sp.]|uniref:hypothetical protein n=1 Tax=Candidatus Poriferisodalis sp. TaxID=3101277 RepID=UPI003C6FE912